MNALVLNQPRLLSMADLPAPSQPAASEALVRVHRVAICGTDLHAFQGDQPFFTYPRVLGHELAVEITDVGPNTDGLRVGDRCAVEPYLSCGSCVACRRGKTNCCVRLQVLGVHADGGMRPLMTVPIQKLHKSDYLSLDALAVVEPLCVGAHAVLRAQLQADESTLVIGAGPIGLSVVQFACSAGARVLVTDVNRDRLNFAREHFPIEAVLEANDTLMEQVRDFTAGDFPTAVIDASGNRRSMDAAFNLVAPGGRLIFVGLHLGDVTFHDPDAHRRELTLLCSRNSTRADFRQVISLLEAGEIETSRWITHRVPFGDSVIDEFPRWLEPQSRFIKALIDL